MVQQHHDWVRWGSGTTASEELVRVVAAYLWIWPDPLSTLRALPASLPKGQGGGSLQRSG